MDCFDPKLNVITTQVSQWTDQEEVAGLDLRSISDDQKQAIERYDIKLKVSSHHPGSLGMVTMQTLSSGTSRVSALVTDADRFGLFALLHRSVSYQVKATYWHGGASARDGHVGQARPAKSRTINTGFATLVFCINEFSSIWFRCRF